MLGLGVRLLSAEVDQGLRENGRLALPGLRFVYYQRVRWNLHRLDLRHEDLARVAVSLMLVHLESLTVEGALSGDLGVRSTLSDERFVALVLIVSKFLESVLLKEEGGVVEGGTAAVLWRQRVLEAVGVLEGAVDVGQLLLHQATLKGLLAALDLPEYLHCVWYLDYAVQVELGVLPLTGRSLKTCEERLLG